MALSTPRAGSGSGFVGQFLVAVFLLGGIVYACTPPSKYRGYPGDSYFREEPPPARDQQDKAKDGGQDETEVTGPVTRPGPDEGAARTPTTGVAVAPMPHAPAPRDSRGHEARTRDGSQEAIEEDGIQKRDE